MEPKEKPRQKIAILGGGIASLTAAYELAVQDRYDITVYQMGWRLGGKGASGRNQQIADRIEEHGLHIWFGFYENAFNLMRRSYGELQEVDSVKRGQYRPFETYKQAFTGQDAFLFTERIGDQVLSWPMDFPPDDDYPGQPGLDGKVTMLPTLWDYFVRILEFLDGHFQKRLQATVGSRKPGTPQESVRSGSFLSRLWNWLKRFLARETEEVFEALLREALKLARTLDSDVQNHHPKIREALIGILKRFKHWLNEVVDESVKRDDNLRRDWIILDLGLTCLIGILLDGVLTKGFHILNGEDLREWLRRHEASPETIDSALIRSLYDIFFAYEEGDINRPNVEAGNALRGSFRTMLTYKGHVLFKMNAGMGDAIFAPLYLVLKERYHVKFQFFHRVKELKLSPDGNEIQQIRVARQVDLKDGKRTDEYQPLIRVDGLPCWPNRPDQSQIVQDLEQTPEHPEGVDLESRWAEWTDAGERTLVAGEHFDQVILGISLAALPFLCPEFQAKGAWREMLDRVKTVVTQSVQLWFEPNPADLKWPVPGGIIGGYFEPFASWGDFDQLQGRESWPPGSEQSVFYTCGVLQDPGIPPESEKNFPERELRGVEDNALDFVQKYSRTLWPGGSRSSGELDFEKLSDLQDRAGEARMKAQFYRVNIDPSERYVLSLKGTSRHRLKAGASGFDNLTVAGTWIDNGFNLSCIEAAVMSGMQASRAISGQPERIVGESD